MAAIRAIDFYFLNLSQLRRELLEAFPAVLAAAAAVTRGAGMTLLDRYEEVVGHQEVERLRRLAERLAGKRIVHVNSTRTGGGVAEILGWMVPLMQELGIDARWEVIAGTARFLSRHQGLSQRHAGLAGLAPKERFRSALRGEPRECPAAEPGGRRRVRPRSAADLPAAVHARRARSAVGCGDATSTPRSPDRAVWKYLERAIADYQATIFSMAAFTRPLACPMFLGPAVDRSAVGQELRDPRGGTAGDAGAVFGIDPERPLLLQVSRFDRFKDPLGVIEAYRLLKPYYPELQLALAGGPADDDPEGAEVLREVLDRAGDDPDMKVLMLPPDAHRTINALQRSAIVVLQKSLKEGFGLTVTEALWKGKPVIGGACGGITLQVHDYHTGFSCIRRPGPRIASATCCDTPTNGSAWARTATSSCASISC